MIKEDDPILEEFPGLSRGDLDWAESLFPGYLMYEREKEGRRVWTSCCHVDGRLFKTDARRRDETWYRIMDADHNAEAVCPWCGRRVTVKNRRKMTERSRWRHEYRPVLFLGVSEDGGTLYAQGYWAWKDFWDRPAAAPLYMPTSVYRFRAGEALQWDRAQYQEAWKMEPVTSTRWAKEPFTEGSGYWWRYTSYHVRGIQAIKSSFLRWADPAKPLTKGEQDLWAYTRKRDRLITKIELAARYPRGYEMMRKAGLYEPLLDWIRCHRKNAAIIRWGETDPRKVFGLTGAELKEFLAGDKSLDTLTALKALRKLDGKTTLAEAETWSRRYRANERKELLTLSKCYIIPPRKLLHYLERQDKAARGAAYTLWKDYIHAAEGLNYNLGQETVLLPKNLRDAHDKATETAALLQERMEEQKMAKRTAALEKRYGFEWGRYLIRSPVSMEEIIREGKELCHCVGGYAARHAEGKTTILFLRDRERPGRSLATIEMHGKTLAQVHGYSNEWKACPENPNKKPARELYAAILDPWLAWVAAGSKRDKQGRPRMPGQKKKEVHEA